MIYLTLKLIDYFINYFLYKYINYLNYINKKSNIWSIPKIEENRKNLPLNVTVKNNNNDKILNDKDVDMLQTIDLMLDSTINLMITHPSGLVILFFSNHLSIYQYNNKLINK